MHTLMSNVHNYMLFGKRKKMPQTYISECEPERMGMVKKKFVNSQPIMKNSFFIKCVIVIFTIFSVGISSGISAQKKNVDMAAKLVGKTDQLGEARRLIKEAMTHPSTKDQARTWFVGGLIEWRSYEADLRKLEINPKDGSVKPGDMASKILTGYSMFMQALNLDTVPDRKGRVKPKFTKDINTLLDAHAYDLYRAGAVRYNEKKYYPEAYTGFLVAADLAGTTGYEKAAKMMPDSVRADSYYYAGLSAYVSNKRDEALKCFYMAERTGMRSPDLYLYLMTLWEEIARDNITRRTEAKDSLLALTERGYKHYGIKPPAFISRMTHIMLSEGRICEIDSILTGTIAANPINPLPLELRGWVRETAGHFHDAVIDYKAAAELPDVSFGALTRLAYLLYQEALEQKEKLSGSVRKQRAARQAIITDILEPARVYAKRARELATQEREQKQIDNLLENIEYTFALLK